MNDTPPEGELVTYEVRDGTAWIALNRPAYRNAQNVKLLRALDEAYAAAMADDDVKCTVLSGNGKHFSAGHDIGSPGRDINKPFDPITGPRQHHAGKPGAEDAFVREWDAYVGLCKRWRSLPKPTIAMVHGGCIAGGLMLAWVCDLIVCSDDAFFSDPVVRMGIPGVEFFSHVHTLGARKAKEFLFLGGRMQADEALACGMVNKVVPRDELESAVAAMAERIGKQPRFGLQLTKMAINAAEDRMGLNDTITATYGYHHLAHAHNALSSDDYIGGQTVQSMKEAGK